MASTSLALTLLGIAALGMLGTHQTLASDSQVPVSFPGQDVRMEIPEWVQLLFAAMLISVFAAAVRGDTKEETLKLTVVPQAASLALRFAVAAGLLGIHGAFSAASSCMPDAADTFPPKDLDLKIPTWAQFLLASLLLTLFHLAICDDGADGELKKWKPTVVPRADSLALRSAVAAGLLGLHCAFGAASAFLDSSIIGTLTPAMSFPPEQLHVEIPVWAQLMMVSLLLCVFAGIIDEDDIERQHGKCRQPKPSTHSVLPEVNVFARRCAAVAGLLGTQLLGRTLADAAGLLASHSALDTPVSTGSPISAPTQAVREIYSRLTSRMTFPLENCNLEIPIWIQLFAVSWLLCVFAAAIAEDDAEREQVKGKVSRPRVVPQVKVLAIRFAAVLGFLGTQGLAEVIRGQLAPMLSLRHVIKTASFPPCTLMLEVPLWSQLLSISLLLIVLAEAIRTETEKATEAPDINASFSRSILWSFGISMSLFAAAHDAFSVRTSMPLFTSAEASIGLPLWVQLCLGGVLLCVFFAFVRDYDGGTAEATLDNAAWSDVANAFVRALQDEANEADEMFQTADVSTGEGSLASSIILRLALLMGILSAYAWLCASFFVAIPSTALFPPKEASVEIAVSTQLLLVSLLVFVFTLAASDVTSREENVSESNFVSQTRTFSLGMLILGCLLGAAEWIQPMMPDVSGDLMLQGGLSIIGALAMLSDSRMQQMLLRQMKQ